MDASRSNGGTQGSRHAAASHGSVTWMISRATRSPRTSTIDSEHTVTCCRRRGYNVMAEPLEELFAREPDDIHIAKDL